MAVTGALHRALNKYLMNVEIYVFLRYELHFVKNFDMRCKYPE